MPLRIKHINRASHATHIITRLVRLHVEALVMYVWIGKYTGLDRPIWISDASIVQANYDWSGTDFVPTSEWLLLAMKYSSRLRQRVNPRPFVKITITTYLKTLDKSTRIAYRYDMVGVKEALTRVRPTFRPQFTLTYKTNQALQIQSFFPSTFRFSHNTTLPAMMNNEINHILSFWYDRPAIEWFMPPAGFDQECKDKFGHLVHQARRDELDSWAEEPKSTLALLILLDQFSRNIFRGTPEMYAADPKALDVATKSIAKQFDKQVTPTQAMTFYLPLVHNESLLAQVAVRALYENLMLRVPEDDKERQFFAKGVSAVDQHLEVIQKFGRFPSRNKILGRESTKEEEEYLKEFPEGFARPPPEAL